MRDTRDQRLHQTPTEFQTRLGNQQISAHLRVVRPLVLGHGLTALVIVAAFFPIVASVPLLAWAAAMLIACAHRIELARAFLRAGRRANPSHARWLFGNSVALGALHAAMLFWLWPQCADLPEYRLLLAMTSITLIAGSTFALASLPRAASTYLSLACGALMLLLLTQVGVASVATALLVSGASIVLFRQLAGVRRQFASRIMRDLELARSQDTIRMLLNDDDGKGADWLFELDSACRIVNSSDRFAAALGVARSELNGSAFIDLFAPSRERTRLHDHLTQKRAFRGLTMALATRAGDDPIWWSVSARPSRRLAHASVAFRGVIGDISATKRAEARVRHMANYDGMTGLPNRLMFNSALAQMVAKDVVRQRMVLLLVDIDHFKSVNDTLGHPIGDQLLKEFSQRLVDLVGDSRLAGEGSIVARLGGDEFAILMGGEDSADQAIRLAELLVTRMAEPFVISGNPIESGASIGMAISPFDGETADQLLHNATLALHFSKDQGRGRWERFEQAMDTQVRERHALERDLRHALVRNELRLFLQPIVDVATRSRKGYEALVRWESVERGLVMPNDFIPLAEETGLIVGLGEWVIRTAMAEAAAWQEPLMIAVNVSPAQLRSPNFLPTIIHGLADTGLDPGRLEIEITEGVLLNDSAANLAVLHKLHGLGVRVSLDDFGTGYSSLNYLQLVPFDKIKIDRSFVSGMETRADCRAIVSSVIELADQLDMVTLAEGVEEESQLEMLRDKGCTMAQGWLFGKAMPAAHYAPQALRDSEKNQHAA